MRHLIVTIGRGFFLVLIYVYKWVVSPCLPMSCRFYPTCSDYAVDALKQHGVIKGLWLTMGRLLRCHPWSQGGCDPVLPNKENE